MTDYKIPELPSDEELGIAGMDERPAAPPARSLRLGRRKRGAKPPKPERVAKPAAGAAWMGPATLLALLALGWATSASRALPRAVPLTAPDTTFASGRALLDVVALSGHFRPVGTAEHEAARAYLSERLVELGLAPEVQTATSLERRGASDLFAATVRNLMARVPGTSSTGAVLLTAHYDSRMTSRGAGDDATGVAVILETVRALRAGPPLRNDVIVLLTDAEELGLLGARAFVEGHPWMDDVAVVLSVEMRGGGGPSVMFETGAENGWIARALDQGAEHAYAFSLGTEVYRRMPNDTDFTPFREAGLQGLNFAGVGRAHVYHQPFDEPARLDERTVQHHGVQLLGVTRVLGERDLANVDAADATFFPVPLLGLVVYATVLGYAVATGLVLLLLVAALRLRRASGGLGGVAVGFVVALTVVGVNAAAAYLAFPWLAGRHVEYGSLIGSTFYEERWYAAALVALSLATATGLLAAARRGFGLGSLALGAALLPALGALAATFLAPSGAPNLQWAALFSAAAAVVVAGVGHGIRVSTLQWVLLMVLAAATLACMVPIVELVWLAFGLGAAALVGGLVAIVPVLLLPLLDSLRLPSTAATAVAALLAVALFGAVGVMQARPTAGRPAPSTLLWALDHDSASAFWATLPDGGEAWAANRTGVALEEARSLGPWLIGGGFTYRTGPAQVVDVPPVEVRVVADSTAGDGRRRMTVALRSPSEAPMVGVRLPGGDVLLQRVNGVAVPATAAADRVGGERVRQLLHYGRPEGELTLELDVGPAVGALALEVFEHHLRPELLLGERWFVRPPQLAPNVLARSDRALTRATVSLEAAAAAGEPAASPGSEVPLPP